MPPIKVADSSLLSRFWFTTDFGKVAAAYDAARAAGPDGENAVEAPRPTASVPTMTSDTGLARLVGHSGDARYKEVFGRAKALGERATNPVGDVQGLALLLGVDLDRLADDLVAMDAKNPITVTEAKEVLATLLRSEEMIARAAQQKPLSLSGTLALLNAGLGCLQLLRTGGATKASLFELVRGEVYDITRPADVLKLAIRTAGNARAMFVDADKVNYAVVAYCEAVEATNLAPGEKAAKKRAMQEKGRAIIAERERLSASLDFTYSVGDGEKKTLEAKLKTVREALRAFRYDLDRLTGESMTTMERFRRRMDDLSLSSRTELTADSFANLHAREDAFNAALEEYGLGYGAAGTYALDHADSREHCRPVTSLTHTANNRIRYYFSGKEQKLEAFRAKAHAVLGGIAKNGGSRTLQFTVSADAKFTAGIADVKAGAKYLRTATVSVEAGGGEVTVTYSNAGAAFASASAKLGLNGGEDASKWSEADRTKSSVAGFSASANGSVSLAHNETIKFRSMEDFIASLAGASDLVERTPFGVAACLGRIGGFFASVGKGIGHYARAFANWTGLRIPKSREDNAAYVEKMRHFGVMGKVDQMLAHRDRGVLTQSGTSWTAGVSGGIGGGVDLGSFGGTTTSEVDGSEKAVKANFFSASGSLTVAHERTFKYNAITYRSFIDAARSYTTDRLEKTAGLWYANLTVPPGASRAKVALVALEEEMVHAEDTFTQLRKDRDLPALDWFVGKWKTLATYLAYVERQEGAPDISAWAERLTAPNVTLTEEESAQLREEAFKIADGAGTRRTSVAFSVNVSVLDSSFDSLSEKTGLSSEGAKDLLSTGMKEVASSLLPTDLTVNGTFIHNAPVTKVSACPWDNGSTNTYAISLSPNLTVRAILETVARRHVDTLTKIDPEERENVFKATLDDLKIGLEESLGTDITSQVWGATMGELAKAAPKLAQFLKAPLLPDAPGGLEVGFDTNYAKTLSFTFGGGRLIAISVDESEAASGSIGLRVPLGHTGVSLGFGIGESLSTKEIGRWAFPRPSLDGMLAQTERFLRTGGREEFKLFLAHNNPGSQRLLRVLRGEPRVAGKDADFDGDRAAFNLRLGEALDILANEASLEAVTPALSERKDRAEALHERLTAARENLALADEPDDDATRVVKLQSFLEALADVFVFARATGDYLRDEKTGALRLPRA